MGIDHPPHDAALAGSIYQGSAAAIATAGQQLECSAHAGPSLSNQDNRAFTVLKNSMQQRSRPRGVSQTLGGIAWGVGSEGSVVWPGT